MKKTQVHVTVDYNVWFYYKTKDINVSKIINELLKLRMEVDETTIDEVQLQKELSNKESEITTLVTERDRLFIQLQTLKEKQERNSIQEQKTREERMNRLKSTVRSIQRSRGFQDAV